MKQIIDSFHTESHTIQKPTLCDAMKNIAAFTQIAKAAFSSDMSRQEVAEHVTNIDVLFYGKKGGKTTYFWRSQTLF